MSCGILGAGAGSGRQTIDILPNTVRCTNSAGAAGFAVVGTPAAAAASAAYGQGSDRKTVLSSRNKTNKCGDIQGQRRVRLLAF